MTKIDNDKIEKIEKLILTCNEVNIQLAEKLAKSLNIEIESLPLAKKLRQWCLFLVLNERISVDSFNITNTITNVMSCNIKSMINLIQAYYSITIDPSIENKFKNLPKIGFSLLNTNHLTIKTFNSTFLEEAVGNFVFADINLLNDKINWDVVLKVSEAITINLNHFKSLMHWEEEIIVGTVAEIIIEDSSFPHCRNDMLTDEHESGLITLLTLPGYNFYNRLSKKGIIFTFSDLLPF